MVFIFVLVRKRELVSLLEGFLIPSSHTDPALDCPDEKRMEM